MIKEVKEVETAIKTLLRKFPGIRSLSPHYDYKRTWVNAWGAKYRLQTFERQREGGSLPLVTHPTAAELKRVLVETKVGRVLDVGCGWGRMLEYLVPEFDAIGCDISRDMLAQCRDDLTVFALDIVEPDPRVLYAMLAHRPQAAFTRGVMLYFRSEERLERAVRTIDLLASEKVFFWEWPEVIERLRPLARGKKFHFLTVPHEWGA